MWFFAMALRVLIIIVWVKMLYISGWKADTAPFCSGIWFILIWIYLALQAIAWPKAILCPLFHKGEWCCKK